MHLVDSMDWSRIVQMTDSRGKPTTMYRGREGQRSLECEVSRAAVYRYGRMSSDTADDHRNTAEFKPLSVPTGRYINYLPWHVRVLETDVLLGRAGVYGWDGKQYDNGVVMEPRLEPDKSTDDDVVMRVVLVVAGVAIVATGVAVTVATGGLAGFIIGGALIGGGLGFGITGAITGDLHAAARAGLIGAAAGAVAGAGASLGMAAVAGLAGITVPQALSEGFFAVAAVGAGGGIVGGFAGGFTETMLQGGSWREALGSGARDAAIGGTLAVGFAGVAAGLGAIGGPMAAAVEEASAAGRGVGSLTRGRRFFYDSRSFREISSEYWHARGAAGGRSLHHWLFAQRAAWVPQGVRNAGFNLLELPSLRGVFHRTLDMNRWMGFARNWGSVPAAQSRVVERALRVGVPASAGAAGYGGYRIGEELYELIDGQE